MRPEHKKYILDNINKKSIEEIAKTLEIKKKKIKKFLAERKYTKITEMDNEKEVFFGTKRHVTKFIVVLIIFMLGLVIYFNSFNNEFVYDDKHHVVNNTAIRSFKNIPLVFQHNLTYFGGKEKGKFFRPIESISFMVDYSLWGSDAFGYHLTNTLLHITVCVLLFYILCFITKNILLSSAISLLYLVHPVHTQAVTYVSGRADSIASIFLLSMVILQYNYWLSKNRYKKAIYYLLNLLIFSLALLSKESAIIFPFLLIFFGYCLKNKENYAKLYTKKSIFYLPFFVISGIWFLLKNKIVPTIVMVKNIPPLSIRLIRAPRLIYDYVRISFFPINLHMDYRLLLPKSIFQNDYFAPFIFTTIFLFLCCYIWKKGRTNINYRIMFFGLGWFLLALFPFLNIVFPLNASFAEHWLYIPEMGLILFVAYFIFYHTKKVKWARLAASLCMVVIIGVYSYLTIKQNTVWKDAITFYTYTIKRAPYSPTAYNNLAVIYAERGNLVEARRLLEKAVRVDPQYATAIKNLQRLESKLKK